jgi:kynurenine formamidase
LIVKTQHNGREYSIDLDSGIDLSIPNRFNGNLPVFYGASSPSIKPVEFGEFIGDVNQGGSCNVKIASVNIHCTGTHSECIGHINDSGIFITDVCPKGFIDTCLVTIKPIPAIDSTEKYHSPFGSHDLVITQDLISEKLNGNFKEGLVIRTIPNSENKKFLNYDKNPAPFLTHDAVDFILEMGVQHLLVDLPSIDKADDGGQLGNHHRFFKKGKTISELLYIPESVKDGDGLLQIQIPNWGLDAAPSRPIFYSL